MTYIFLISPFFTYKKGEKNGKGGIIFPLSTVALLFPF